MSGGRRTGRVAYALGARNLPKPVTGAQWQLDAKFNVSDELLQDPSLRDVIKGAIDTGVEVVTWDGVNRTCPAASRRGRARALFPLGVVGQRPTGKRNHAP